MHIERSYIEQNGLTEWEKVSTKEAIERLSLWYINPIQALLDAPNKTVRTNFALYRLVEKD